MSQFLCHCGFVISDNQCPAVLDYYVFRDDLYYKVLERMGNILEQYHECKSKSDWIERELGIDYPKDASFSMVAEDIMTRELLQNTIDLFQCPSCKRLYLQSEIQKNEYSSFVPEQTEDPII